MVYYLKKDYKIIGYRKSEKKGKKYDAVLQNISMSPRNRNKIIYIPFGAIGYGTYRDLTGLNLYTVHNDPVRRKNYRARHKNDLKTGYYSPGWFSYYITW
mgnify:FL=1